VDEQPDASNGTSRRGPDRGHLLVTAQFACFAGVAWPGPAQWDLPMPVRLGAAGLAVAGGALALAGAGRLGRRLKAHPAPHPEGTLRTDGAYRFVRHPIYSGVLLGCAGVAVLRERPEPLVAVAVLTGVLTVKTRYEERLLRAHFGPAYDDYAARVPALVPRPWRRAET
jgi:protein-S-isoprenylcysteine O-methyltransferase Ste14